MTLTLASRMSTQVASRPVSARMNLSVCVCVYVSGYAF